MARKNYKMIIGDGMDLHPISSSSGSDFNFKHQPKTPLDKALANGMVSTTKFYTEQSEVPFVTGGEKPNVVNYML